MFKKERLKIMTIKTNWDYKQDIKLLWKQAKKLAKLNLLIPIVNIDFVEYYYWDYQELLEFIDSRLIRENIKKIEWDNFNLTLTF